MELKVWVDGVHRVVCGITKQTTVQEVVIALAQATGRTGRYTLVEKWKTDERMLPPSEHPLQILSIWGERAGEVQFVLRRTGASTSVSESGDDKVVMPERSTHRSSLPPQLKHKQRKDALLSRKEPKRKSLDISGGSESVNKYKPRSGEKRSEEKGVKSPKKATIPFVFLPHTRLSSSETGSGQPQSKASVPAAKQPESSKKKPLMPPTRREPRPTFSPSPLPPQGDGITKHERKTSTGNESRGSKRQSYVNDGEKRLSQSKLVDTAKARAEFTRLVIEQHQHVNDQNLTLDTLEEEKKKFQALIQRHEESEILIQKEIDSIEKTIRRNEIELKDESSLKEVLQSEGSKGSNLQSETMKYKADISSIDDKIREMEEQMYFLQEEIEREKRRQAQEIQNNLQIRYKAAEEEMQKANSDISKTLNELKLVEDDIKKAESDVNQKRMKLEALNRELRQVNLQQFIRQTGSKVTVLPPEVETDGVDIDLLKQQSLDSSVVSAGSEPGAGGVWV